MKCYTADFDFGREGDLEEGEMRLFTGIKVEEQGGVEYLGVLNSNNAVCISRKNPPRIENGLITDVRLSTMDGRSVAIRGRIGSRPEKTVARASPVLLHIRTLCSEHDCRFTGNVAYHPEATHLVAGGEVVGRCRTRFYLWIDAIYELKREAVIHIAPCGVSASSPYRFGYYVTNSELGIVFRTAEPPKKINR